MFNECTGFRFAPEWADLYKPKLTIYGERAEYDTIRTKIYYGGTYIYEYDDFNRNVTIKKRVNNLTGNNFTKTRYHFDGFGNIKEKMYIQGRRFLMTSTSSSTS